MCHVFRHAAGLDGSGTYLPLGDAEGLMVGWSVGHTDVNTAATSGVRVAQQRDNSNVTFPVSLKLKRFVVLFFCGSFRLVIQDNTLKQ